MRVTQGGLPEGEGVLGDSIFLRLYYTYGIPNSFGFNFDPLTGNIWDAQNGADDKDEINLVKPGFNSGWDQVMSLPSKRFDPERDLVSFNGKGKPSTQQIYNS